MRRGSSANLHSSRRTDTSSDGDIRNKHHIETELLLRHLGEVEVAHSLVVVGPLSLGTTFQSLIAIELDSFIEILRIYAAVLLSEQTHVSYLSWDSASSSYSTKHSGEG